jgi:hypothetical protein
MLMKIRFVKNVVVDVRKVRLEETWDRSFHRWEEVRVDNIIDNGESVDLVTYEGDVIENVPADAFEVVR